MTGQQRDFEEVLSRVLHRTADQVEPVGDGLTKIRGRLAEPWLKRQWWLLRSELMMLRWLVVVRSGSFFSSVRSRFAATDVTAAGAGTAAPATTGAAKRRRGALPVLGGILAWASSKGAPGDGQRRSPGPVMNWLRPALAVAGAVILVVAGVFALGQIRQGIVSLSNGSGVIAPGSSSQGGPNGGTNGSGSKTSAGSRSPSSRGSSKPKRGVSQHVGASSSPSPCATPSSSPQPSPSPSSSPAPSPTSSPTISPTTSPTPTASPSPTTSSGPASGFQSPPPVGGYPAGGHGASTTALMCVPQPGPSPSTLVSPA
jgi:hypothetical protein